MSIRQIKSFQEETFEKLNSFLSVTLQFAGFELIITFLLRKFWFRTTNLCPTRQLFNKDRKYDKKTSRRKNNFSFNIIK